MMTRLRRAAALTATLFMVGSPVLAWAEPAAGPDPNTCPYKVSTPPAVDSSEVPTAGDPPQPLPVPASAVGGEALSGCGVIVRTPQSTFGRLAAEVLAPKVLRQILIT